MRYRQQSEPKHCTKLILSAHHQCLHTEILPRDGTSTCQYLEKLCHSSSRSIYWDQAIYLVKILHINTIHKFTHINEFLWDALQIHLSSWNIPHRGSIHAHRLFGVAWVQAQGILHLFHSQIYSDYFSGRTHTALDAYLCIISDYNVVLSKCLHFKDGVFSRPARSQGLLYKHLCD